MTQLELTDADLPPWFSIARKEIGVHEAPGVNNSARVQDYFGATSLGPHTPDSIPWCSAFANWAMKQAGFACTNSAAARSWLDWGVPLMGPQLGCVIVFSRPLGGPASGHVGFVAQLPSPNAANVMVLGGNQSDRVCIEPYPIARVLGWRWPTV